MFKVGYLNLQHNIMFCSSSEPWTPELKIFGQGKCYDSNKTEKTDLDMDIANIYKTRYETCDMFKIHAAGQDATETW